MSETTGQCETPMRDHVARFWSLLASGKVRLCVDADFHEGSSSFFSSSMFSDDVAKALIKDRASTDKVRELEAALAEARRVIEDAKRHMATGANSFAYSALNDWLSSHKEQSK